MSSALCTHGLVQLARFGTDEREGLDICRGCGLPTSDSVLRSRLAASNNAHDSSPSPDAGDTVDAALRSISDATEHQRMILEQIRVLAIIGVACVSLVLVIALGFLLGFWHLEVTPYP